MFKSDGNVIHFAAPKGTVLKHKHSWGFERSSSGVPRSTNSRRRADSDAYL